MQSAPLSTDENARIALLHELQVLDTAADPKLDELVQFTSVAFGVPIVLVSVVDVHRQWFKARVGLEACETSREVSFCAHAILTPRVMVIPDATLDPRFHDNPLVLGPPYIRFYAGAPLPVAGQRIGTLCLIDPKPHPPATFDAAMLERLAAVAAARLAAIRPAKAA